MEEAYTIGVRLALDDEVSAGLAVIGAQLAALDRAVTARLGELGRLQREGARAVAGPVAEAARQLPRGVAAEAPAPTAADAAVGGVRPVVTAMLAAPPVPAQAVRSESAPADPPRPIVAPVSEPGERLAASDMRQVRSWADISMPALAPQPVPPVEAPMKRPGGEASQFAPPQIPVVPPVAPLPSLPMPLIRTIAPAEAVSAAPVAIASPMAAVAPSPMAPVAPTLPRAVPEVSPRMQVAAAEPGAETPRTQGTGQGGDVYLDGARMGRWMVDRLAREAERPQAGGTGFDRRMSPDWGGTV